MTEKKQELVKAGTTTPTPVEMETRPIEPRYEIREGEQGYTLTLEMPGVNKESLDIRADHENLRVHGKRSESFEGLSPILVERPRAEYLREFSMDDTIDWDKIAASVRDGIVTLEIPKASHAKPRRIHVS